MEPNNTADPKPRRRTLWTEIAAAAVLVIITTPFIVLARRKPFARSSVVTALQQASGSVVEINYFHSSYFPRPRCVAEDVSFFPVSTISTRDRRPQVTIQRLTIESSFIGLFTRHIEVIRLEGVNVRIASLKSKPTLRSSGDFRVREILASRAIVEFESHRPGRRPLRFDVHQSRFVLNGDGEPVSFSAALLNPEPPGEVEVNGRLGPWKTDNPGQTPLSGSYTFQQARLGVFQAIAGTLDSQGRFSEVVEHLEVEGSTDTPDFQANQTSHLVHLKTHFQAVVNATNGDTFLQPVEGYFERTKITARGEVAGKRGGGRRKGKTASLHMTGEGRIENLFRLLVRSEPPIKGNVNFSTQVQVPPGDLQFLKKIYLEGDFQIAEATFVNPARQSDVRRLSIRARGLKNRGSETIESSLKGHVTLRNAVANFSGFSISIPGASALLSGTYNLLNERINLHGTLRMDSSISHATTGLKSVLLKVLNPVLKKKRSAGSVLPVRITGTYRQPSFGLAVASGQ